MAKNTKGKTRDINNPYEIWVNPFAGWEWRVLKHYKSTESEDLDPYARVFTAVKSPMTWGGYDMGDTYLQEIKANATLAWAEGDDPAEIETW